MVIHNGGVATCACAHFTRKRHGRFAVDSDLDLEPGRGQQRLRSLPGHYKSADGLDYHQRFVLHAGNHLKCRHDLLLDGR